METHPTVEQAGVTASPSLPANLAAAYATPYVPFPSHWSGHLRTNTESLFRDGRFDDCVRDAMVFMETRLRALIAADHDKFGLSLIEEAFRVDFGFLDPVYLPKSEREGTAHLFRGAIQQIRNAAGHRNNRPMPGETYDTVAFVNYLVNLAEGIALRRYVYPYFGRWSMLSIDRVYRRSLGPSFEDSIILVIRYRGEQSNGVVPLVLKKDGSSRYQGAVPVIPGSVANELSFIDLEGDGSISFLLSAGDREEGSEWEWRCAVFALDENGYLTGRSGGDNCLSRGMPFEFLQPASGPSWVVGALRQDRSYDFWRVEADRLVEVHLPSTPSEG